MKITLDWLKEKSACEDGIAWFEGNFGNEADCQKVLNELGKLDKVDWARWLINKAGPTTAVLEIQGNVEIEHSLFALGNVKVVGKIACNFLNAGLGIEAGEGIKAGLGIEAGEGIKAGLGIEAGEGIKAGLGIEAGEGIKAGWGIKAGEGIEAVWGIEAGLGIEAVWGIEAGEGIKAGWGIKAGAGINAGEDFGIYAGLKIKLSQKNKYAIVKAKTEPKSLLLGTFVPVGGGY